MKKIRTYFGLEKKTSVIVLLHFTSCPTFDDVTATLMGVRDWRSLIIGIIVSIDALHSMMSPRP